MTLRLSSLLLCVAAALPATALAKSYEIEDFSSAGLIDKPSVMSAWKEALPEARLVKLYPTARWGFLSQVEGGIVDSTTCVVTARVTMLPKTAPTRRLVWEPNKSSTTYGAKLNASPADCTAFARTKLDEALRSLVSSLVK
jgi:hypothetical protein